MRWLQDDSHLPQDLARDVYRENQVIAGHLVSKVALKGYVRKRRESQGQAATFEK